MGESVHVEEHPLVEVVNDGIAPGGEIPTGIDVEAIPTRAAQICAAASIGQKFEASALDLKMVCDFGVVGLFVHGELDKTVGLNTHDSFTDRNATGEVAVAATTEFRFAFEFDGIGQAHFP